MTRDDYILLDDDDLAKQCRLDTFRGSGPGGQHRNVTDSAVRLTLEANPEITVTCCEGRSQHDNRKLAVRRLTRHGHGKSASRRLTVGVSGCVVKLSASPLH